MLRSKMSKTLMVVGLASTLLLTSACSKVEILVDSGAKFLTPKEPVVTVIDGVEYGPTVEGMYTLPDLASDKNGEWRKTTILPNDPAFTFDPAVVDVGATQIWGEEEIKEAQRFAVELAVDAIDTPANGAPGDTASMEKWWETNEDKFHPNWKESMRDVALNPDPNEPIVFKAPHRKHDDASLDYGMWYGEFEVHVKDRKIDTVAIGGGEIPEGRGISIYLDVDFASVVKLDDMRAVENTAATLTYTLTKDEDTGKFLVVGYDNSYNLDSLR